MREKWSEALSHIDEKYVDEAAKALSKNISGGERSEITDERPKVIKLESPKKSRKGIFTAAGCTAAAAALVIGGALIAKNGGLVVTPNESGSGTSVSETVSDTPEISTDSLTDKFAFNPRDYAEFAVETTDVPVKNELDEYMIERLTEIFDRFQPISKAQYFVDFTEGINNKLYAIGESGKLGKVFSIGYSGEKLYYSYASRTDVSDSSIDSVDYSYYEISQEFYDELLIFFQDYAPQCILAEIKEVEGNGSYIADDIRIHTDREFKVGDMVNITYFGGIMETYPAQVRMLDVRTAATGDVRNDFDETVGGFVSYNKEQLDDGSTKLTDITLYQTSMLSDGIPDLLYSFPDYSYFRSGGTHCLILPPDTKIACESCYLSKTETSAVQLKSVFIPFEENGEILYDAAFFLDVEDFNNELIYLGKADEPIRYIRMAKSNYSFPSAIAMITADGGVAEYRIDIENRKLAPIYGVPTGEITEFVADMKPMEQITDNFGDYLSYLHGYWVGSSGAVDATLYSKDLFSMADPCVGMTKYYMYTDNDIWYIPEDNNGIMYYFENVKDGDRLKLSDCTAYYYRFMGDDGFHRGSLPLGYFGLADLTYGDSIERLFELSFTDENGTRWVRTKDYSIDWGDVYTADVVGENDITQTDFHLKMMNADNPSEMKYFSFSRIDDFTSELTVADEHYSFDVSICDPELFPSQRLSNVLKTSGLNARNCYFSMDVTFYPIEGEHYYAIREIGRTGSQWNGDFELYFHDENGYRLVADSSVMDYYKYNSRMLVTTKTELIICDDGTETRRTLPSEMEHMGSIQEIGRYLFFGNEKCLIYDTVTGGTISEYDSLRFSEDYQYGFELVIDKVRYEVTAEADTVAPLFETTD